MTVHARQPMRSALTLDPITKARCGNAIVVTGVGRSGTTIMGKLLHSMEEVEYVYEPPVLYSLLPLIDRLDRETWELLYETYLFKEFLFNALAGRGLNCNLEDDSSIHRVKDEAWVRYRLSRSLRKGDAEAEAGQSRIAYKMPDIAPFIPRLQEYYPHTRVVMMLRNANDVIHSVMERGWFSDEVVRHRSLSVGPAASVWPNHQAKGVTVPCWVPEDDVDFWIRSDELHRTAYYYVRAHREMEQIRNLATVKYDELVQDPRRVFGELAASLGLTMGPKTPEILAQVRKTTKERDQGYVDRLTGELKERVISCSALSDVL